MKTIIRSIVCLGVLVAAVSCQQYYIDTQMTPEKAAANIRMVCDALPSYTAPATRPDAITFNVSSNTPWTITRSSGADWCTVTPSSSAQSALISSVVVTLDDNPDGTDRSATLTLKGENIAAPVTITISQARKGRLFVTPVAKDYSAAGGPLNFTINTNQDWEVRTDVSWLHFNRENGTPDPDGRTMTIIATADPSNVMERTATVTVIAGDDEETFEVAQVGIFTLTEVAGGFTSEGGTQVMKIRTDLPWTVASDKNWVSFDPESGNGDGTTVNVNVTAAKNGDASRKAVITVTAGDAVQTFEVTQEGAPFEIVTPESTEISGEAAEIVLAVNTALDWEPSTEVEGWSVEKVDAAHFKVKAGWNNSFAPKKGKVAITGAGNAYADLELTQDVNFTFEGNCEVLEDGSVKISAGARSRVRFKNNYKHATFILKMGDVHFEDNGEFWLVTHEAGGIKDCEIENRISLYNTSNIRLRANAQFPDGSAKASGSATYSDKVNKDVMNTLKEYRVDFVSAPNPDTSHPERTLRMAFTLNGTLIAEQWVADIFDYAGQDMAAPYWFGYNTEQTDGTWYIVKSCDLTLYD